MTTDLATSENLALALSGGGARAIAFHLGCLRALHRNGLLGQVETIASVSGGSVIAALYCHHDGDFASFEAKVRALLARGFVWPALRTAVTTLEGIKALATAIPLAIDRLAAFALRWTLGLVLPRLAAKIGWLKAAGFRRRFSRTTILRRTVSRMFGGAMLTALRADRPKLIIVACELQARSAFYFAKEGVGSWRLGSAAAEHVEIAHAVIASAAFPAALPALDEAMDFEKDGIKRRARVILTDGGVYDNLGLAPLWPDRDDRISLHVAQHDRIIACRAGYGLHMTPPTMFWPSRMLGVIESIHARAQNFAVTRLFDLVAGGRLKGAILPYLDQDDARLAYPPADLVARGEVADYATDFSAMPAVWIDKLSRRGEQLVDALIAEHWFSR